MRIPRQINTSPTQYLDGRLGDDELREQISHHARQCPECSEELEILKRALVSERE
jgi:hypothetical protein